MFEKSLFLRLQDFEILKLKTNCCKQHLSIHFHPANNQVKCTRFWMEYRYQWRTKGGWGGVPPQKFRSFGKAELNLQFHGKYAEPLSRGLPPPDSHSICPLSPTEFVDPPPQKKKKYLGMPLMGIGKVPVHAMSNMKGVEV
jgi:hypothetical protein